MKLQKQIWKLSQVKDLDWRRALLADYLVRRAVAQTQTQTETVHSVYNGGEKKLNVFMTANFCYHHQSSFGYTVR